MKKQQNGFITPLIFIAISMLIIGGGWYMFQDTKKEKDESNISKQENSDPLVVTTTYYKNIIDRLNGKVSVDLSLNPVYVTEKIINNFETFKKENPEILPYNPLTCAQDSPDNTNELSFTKVQQNDSVAVVSVKLMSGWSPISVSLTNQNGWKINGITCNKGGKL